MIISAHTISHEGGALAPLLQQHDAALLASPDPAATLFGTARWTGALAAGYGPGTFALRHQFRLLIAEQDGQVLGGLAVYIRQRWGVVRRARLPLLTAYSAPWVADAAGRDPANRAAVLRALLQHWRTLAPQYRELMLPPGAALPGGPEACAPPIAWRKTRLLPTAFLADEILLARLSPAARRHVKKSDQPAPAAYPIHPARILELAGAAIGREGAGAGRRGAALPPGLLPSIVRLAADFPPGAAPLRFAMLADGPEAPGSLLLLAADNKRAYYLLAGATPEARSAGAPTRLLHAACHFLRDEWGGLPLDLLGCNMPSIARFKAGFGGEEVPVAHLRCRGVAGG